MKILICDDEQLYVNNIKKHIELYESEKGLSFEIDTYTDAQKLLECTTHYDIAFLDVEIGNIKGTDVAKRLKTSNNYIIIFIITSYDKYLDEAMDLNVLRFIVKPIDAKRLYDGMDKAIGLINNNEITFKTRNDGIVTIHKNDIIYVEVKRKIVYVNTVEKQYIAREKMDFFKENLTSSYFAIPHISYVINFNFVKKFQRDKVQLKNNHIISIAPKKQTEIKKKFMNFMGEGYGGLSDNF